MPAYFNDAQRQATKDAGPHRGARRAAHRQRADRGRRSPTGCSSSPRGSSRSTTWAAGPSTSRSCASRTASSRCSPPTATRTWAATTSTGRWWTGCSPTSRPRTAWTSPATPRRVQELRLGRGGREVPALVRGPRRPAHDPVRGLHVSPRHHPRRRRGPDRRRSWTRPSARAGRRSRMPALDADQVDEVVLVGGSTRMPLVRRRVEELFGRTPAQPAQSGRGGGARGRRAGADPGRRHHRHAAARRDAAVARHRDPGRHRERADRRATPRFRRMAKEHVHHLGGRPDRGGHARAPGRARAGRATTARWPASICAGIDPMPARHAQDRGHLSHRRQRHSPGRRRKELRTGKAAAIEVQADLRPHRGPRWSGWWRTRSRTRRPTSSARLLIETRTEADTVAQSRGARPAPGRATSRARTSSTAIEAARDRAARAARRGPTATSSASAPPTLNQATERLARGHDGPRAQGRARLEAGRPAPGSQSVMAVHKVTFLPQNVTVEVDDAKYPLADHGRPGSLLDIALANDIHLEHNCGGSCACTTCHVIVREGEDNLSADGAGRGGSPGHRGGADPPLAARLPGGGQGRRGRGDPEVGRAAAEGKASE